VNDLDFPYRLDARGRSALAGEAEHVRDMIEQLLFTTPGERVNRPDFGCGVLQLVFAPSGPELAVTVQFTVQAALQRWLGDVIEVSDLAVTAVDSTLTVELEYVIRRTREARKDTFTRSV
jgi:hypothetical protein